LTVTFDLESCFSILPLTQHPRVRDIGSPCCKPCEGESTVSLSDGVSGRSSTFTEQMGWEVKLMPWDTV